MMKRKYVFRRMIARVFMVVEVNTRVTLSTGTAINALACLMANGRVQRNPVLELVVSTVIHTTQLSTTRDTCLMGSVIISWLKITALAILNRVSECKLRTLFVEVQG
jgi:hypothetical protein